MKVYVFVALRDGIEEETRVFRKAQDADKCYEDLAEKLGLVYDKEMQDYNWSDVDCSAWWSECEVE